MKNRKQILEQLERQKADERNYYPSAKVTVNAPLALIQMANESQMNTLEWVLGLPLSKFPLKK